MTVHRRGRLLTLAGLVLVAPAWCQAQETVTLPGRALPQAVTRPVSSSSLAATRASGPRSGRRDSLLNGTVIGAAVGAALGIALVHATRDSELDAGQYAGGALIFGGIGAGVGLGLDALFDRSSTVVPGSPRRVALHTRVTRKAAGLRLVMRW